MVFPSSIPCTVTASPKRPAVCVCGSRLKICRVVSSNKTSFAPGVFSVHLSASAKASSTVQPLLIRMPDQAVIGCPTDGRVLSKRNTGGNIHQSFFIDIQRYHGGRNCGAVYGAEKNSVSDTTSRNGRAIQP